MAVGSELAQLLEARRRMHEDESNNESPQPPSPPKPTVNKLSQDKFSLNNQKIGSHPQVKTSPQKTWSSKQSPKPSSPSIKSIQSKAPVQSSHLKTTHQPTQSELNARSHMAPENTIVRAPSPSINKQWDQTNLDKGIPTPSFLVEMRNNLKKRDVSGGVVVGARAVDAEENANNTVASVADEVRIVANDGNKESNRSYDVEDDSVLKVEQSARLENKASSNTKPQSLKTLDSSGTTSTSSSPRHCDLSARRSRLVARTNHVTNSGESIGSNTSPSKTKEPPSPNAESENSSNGNNKSNQRRERILAKVRANTNKSALHSQSRNLSQQQASAKRVQSPALVNKVKVTSPHANEVEMMFAEEGFVPSGSGDDSAKIPMARTESIDSISNEVQQTAQRSTLMAMAMANKAHDDSNISTTSNYTPQKSQLSDGCSLSQQQRLHMASTPKIRGNAQYRRDNFEGKGEEGLSMQQDQEDTAETLEEEDVLPMPLDSNFGSKQKPRRGSYSHCNLQYNPSPQSQPQYIGHPDDEKPHNINHAYPLNERAPSTISAISGLSNPSCFPQETPVGHLQQPMLVGGSHDFNSSPRGNGAFVINAAIKESTSFNSANSGTSGFDNNLRSSPRASSGMGISAFSSGVENENRRLRQQLGSMQKKLQEKDAIISQLMKRIADLETAASNNNIRGEKMNMSTSDRRSYSMDHDSYTMSSLWDHSHPASAVYSPSFNSNRSPSADAESSISMSSPPQHLSVKRSIAKQSPNTTHTSSTASVTTANSGRSHQPGNSSKSLPGQRSPASIGRRRRSTYRRGCNDASSDGRGDDRRFRC